LKKFDGGREELATSVLLLLHHALLIRSGCSVVETDAVLGDKDSPSQQRSSSEGLSVCEKDASSTAKGVEGLESEASKISRQTNQILRKHLAMFVLSAAAMTSHPLSWAKQELPHCPPYSRLQIASSDCCELLVSAAVVSAPPNQAYLFSAISHLIDGNPANAFKFVQRPAICTSMIQLVPHLQEQCQQMVGYILSQALRYSIQMPALRELIRAVRYSKASSQDDAPNADGYNGEKSPEDCDTSSSSSGSKTLLFVMGRTAERTAAVPDAFLHFDSSCPFEAKVELPSVVPLAGSPLSAADGISVCTWIRLGTLAHSHAVSALQLYTEDSSNSSDSTHVLVNAYFRVVYKLVLSANKSRLDDFPSRLGSSDAAETMQSHKRVSKRLVQLCFGFRKAIHPLTPSEQAELSSSSQTVSSINRWTAAVEQLSMESCLASDEPVDPAHQRAISKLANTINHFAIPDAIVEFDWTEMGEWHLLCISIGRDSIRCSVDGVQKPVVYWTPLGFRSLRGPHPSHVFGSMASTDAAMQPIIVGDGASSSPYCDFSKITKESPLKVILGGLQYEYASWQVLQSNVRRTSPLLHALSSLMAGFAGSVGEVAVFAGGPPDAFTLHCMVRAGPGQGLRDLKATRLSELTSHFIVNTLSAAGSSPGVCPISSHCDEKVDHPHDSSTLIYSSNMTTAVKRDVTQKVKDALGLRFFESIQIHRTSSVASTLKCIGGLRLLYPLLVVDKARLVAALRMVGSILLSSSEAYKDFQSTDTDKVILHCALHQPSLITLETLQVLFDLICDPAMPSSSPSLFPRAGSVSTIGVECSEVIHRQTLLDLLFLIVLSSRNCQLARSAVDWMREICDDEIQNCQKLLKSAGLVPVLVMLSVWDVCGSDPQVAKSPELRSLKRSDLPPTAEVEAVDPSDPISDSYPEPISDTHPETAAELASLANKYKLQVSCYRLVKLLITGTAEEVDRGRIGSSLTHTLTDFNATHLSVLLSFVATTNA